MDKKTTIAGVISGLGSALVAMGYFYPPLILVGGLLSGVSKAFLGYEAADSKRPH
jgi:hypothetical protein